MGCLLGHTELQHIIDEKAAIEKSSAEAMRHKMMEKYITD